VHIIPIQCAGIPCPNCGKLQNLHYKIHDIKTSKYSFKFEAKIECKKCDMKKSFTKVLGKISEIIRIDVKPTGITATLKEG
jgi:C4-type Zn-finger protein